MNDDTKLLSNDYIPKDATQQSEFIKKYPEYDGRGILIAILDSGVDVCLPGMQYTTTGLPKIHDCFDFNVDITVDTSTVRKAKADNTLICLSGQNIEIPSKWKNPSGNWHLGRKTFEELCLQEMNTKNFKGISDINLDENTKKKLKIFEKNIGFVPAKNALVDCIVWFDGKKWQAIVDFSFSRNLRDAKILTNYRDSHEYGLIFGQISYSIEICSNGNMMKFITAVGNHGTTVAHVAAANFPGEPHRNGLAPGAQIVSMNFKGSKSLKNALLKCIDLKVDIINLSFRISKESNISTILKDMTEKYGIIVLNSGGNAGPSHSTIPNNYADFYGSAFLIGSVLTKQMEKKLYGINHVPLIFPYSSKGPMMTGERGIDFTAPGAAVTAVSKWLSKNNQISYGTSVACPNAAGAIACLLSSLKANSVEYNPTTIKLALSNTAFIPDGGDRLAFGNGIIQINAAFEFFKNFNNISTQIPPKISVYESNKKAILKTAIYFIQKETDATTVKYCVKLNFEKNVPKTLDLKLESKNAETFIEHSKTVKNNMFFVKIFTSLLKSGSINYAEIHGIDSSLNPLFGPLFHLPITVVIPQKIIQYKNFCITKKLILDPWVPHHIFLCPPFNSKQCNLKITMLQQSVVSEIFIQHTLVQKDTQPSNDDNTLRFAPNEITKSCNFSVEAQKMYEISIFRGLNKDEIFKNIILKLQIDFSK